MGNCLSAPRSIRAKRSHVQDATPTQKAAPGTTSSVFVTSPSSNPSITPFKHTDTTPPTTTAPGPSTSTALASHQQNYEVFISHAGEDKATIAIPLRQKLMAEGITAFVDEADILRGADANQAMMNAMERATVAIVVLSPKFIARKWPMRELMYFLSRREDHAAGGRVAPVIIPCFYRLSVSELYREPRFNRRDKNGKLLYRESRFYERRNRGEPEASVDAIKAALKTLHGIMGVRNDMDASNDPSFVMTRRRQVLLQEICDKTLQTVPARAADLRSVDHAVNDGQIQAPVHSFRNFFPPTLSSVRAVLNFENIDEDGNPITPEGRMKQHFLEQSTQLPSVFSIHGIAGVGKSTIMRALSLDPEIHLRFPDGIHLLRLGQDASPATLFGQICQVLHNSGAEKTSQSLRMRNDVDEALDFLENWFDGKRCAFLIDDAWVHGVGLHLLSRLSDIGSGMGGSSVLFTTREHEVATLAPSRRILRLEPRDVRGPVARQILCFHADIQETRHSNADIDDSVNSILDMCAGLPVILAAAGKNVKKMNMDMPSSEDRVWKRYVSQLAACRDRLLWQNVGTYGNLFATFATAISFLDEKPHEDTLGFASPWPFAKMHRRLCVLQKQAVVPHVILKHLWQVECDEYADVIATIFVESGLASRESVRAGREDVCYLSLHDSLHDFALAEAKRNSDTKEAHDCLLRGYSSCDLEISCKLRGTLKWWSPRLKTDGYVHENLCRHLLGAGRAAELVALLLSPKWAERQLEVNNVLFLEADFALGLKAVQKGMSDVNDADRSDLETALQLVSDAVTLSSEFISRNIAELSFQMQGRLKRYQESCGAIREYLNWAEADGTKPFVVCKSSFLAEPGGRNTRIVAVNIDVNCMVLLNDGKRVACGCWNGRIVIINTAQNAVEQQWMAHDNRGCQDSVITIAAGRDRALLVSGSLDGVAKVWDLQTGRCVTSFEGHTSQLKDVAVMSDGRRVISVYENGTAQLWDGETGRVLSDRFTGHDGSVDCVVVLGDGEEVVTGGRDKGLRQWNVMTGVQIGDTFEGHEAGVKCVAMTPDGKRIVSGSQDKTVRVWDVETNQQIGNSFKGHTSTVASVAVSRDGRRIASGSCDGTIRVWDLENGAEVCEPLEGHRHAVTGVSFLAGGDCIVSSSFDGTVRVWDVRRKQKERFTNRHKAVVTSVSFAPNGTFVVSGSIDKTLRIWNTSSGAQDGDPLKGHSKFVRAVTITPNGRIVLSVSDDEILRIWDVKSRKLLHRLSGHTAEIRCVAVTPHGDSAVTGSCDKTLRIWDMASMDGSHVTLEGHCAEVRNVFITDDGLRIVSVDLDENICVWELETKKLIKRFRERLAWSLQRRYILTLIGEPPVPDDTKLSISTYSREIVYGEGQYMKVLATMETDISSWALSPDKKTICVGLIDGKVGFMKLVG